MFAAIVLLTGSDACIDLSMVDTMANGMNQAGDGLEEHQCVC